MKILIDTHIFLWYLRGETKLPISVRKLLDDQTNERFISMASVWEMALKLSIGKLKIAGSFKDFIQENLRNNNFTLLNLTLDHIHQITELPFHHRDPFDRLLIAQSMVEQIPIVTLDPSYKRYRIQMVVFNQ